MAMRCNGNGQNLVALTGLAPNSKDVNEDGAFVAAARATQHRHGHTPSPTGTRRNARTLVVNQPTCVVVLAREVWTERCPGQKIRGARDMQGGHSPTPRPRDSRLHTSPLWHRHWKFYGYARVVSVSRRQNLVWEFRLH